MGVKWGALMIWSFGKNDRIFISQKRIINANSDKTFRYISCIILDIKIQKITLAFFSFSCINNVCAIIIISAENNFQI